MIRLISNKIAKMIQRTFSGVNPSNERMKVFFTVRSNFYSLQETVIFFSAKDALLFVS
jgi:hypothetical protein